MRVVVIGGTGLVGTLLVHRLVDRGHDADAASPTTGVNTITRIGLATALTGADVVVDVSDAPSFDDDAVLEHVLTSGRNLAAAEATAGVGHHVALSVVGADRLTASGYLRAKLAQEALVRAAGIPFTILRSTHSFELLRSVADAATDGDVVRISPALVQPVAAEDIAATLAGIGAARPTGATEELGGPEAMPLVDLVARVLAAQHDTRPRRRHARRALLRVTARRRHPPAGPPRPARGDPTRRVAGAARPELAGLSSLCVTSQVAGDL